MNLPQLNEITTSRSMIDVFKGYNHNLRIGDGEFYDMQNLTSNDYPVLSPRSERGVYAEPTNPQGLIAKDSLCYIDCEVEDNEFGAKFYLNGNEVEGFTLSSKAEDLPKTLVSMGAYIIIMPDKKYINTEKPDTDRGNIEASVDTAGIVTFELCKLDGEGYGNPPKNDEAPLNPQNLDLWIDTSSVPHTLKQYSTANAMWVAIATTYIKISATGIGKPFNEGDGVTISGINREDLQDLNNTMVIWAKGDDYIVVTGILDTVYSQEEPIKVERLMPILDFVIESENRLWGCHYGIARNGQVVNEIYCSKLGDFKNWNCFAGISTDSYVASVGTDGQFTGAITHLGYPLFFKENCVHKVYGNYPANYQIQTTTCRGVQKGCSRSLAIVNEVLYYKSRSGVCAYDGSLPAEMSAALGDVIYSDAVAGSIGNKYYISMADTTGTHRLFAYDTKKGMWHKESNTYVRAFCNCRGDLYFIDDADNKIKTVLGTGTKEPNPIMWMAETGVLGASLPDKKYISRLDIRMSLKIGTRVYFYIQYDSSGEWEHLFTMTGRNLRSFAVPIRPKRCDHFRLRIEGVGDAKIFSICETLEQGSDK